eukprot:m.300842 g.300842  ORF g.300842 m.300842 type:complete len:456 (-) comp20132_c0_seq4:377-1744(-)
MSHPLHHFQSRNTRTPLNTDQPTRIRTPRFWLKTAHDSSLSDSFVVVSYNILSDKLLDDNKYLYRARQQYTLPWEYRAPRLVQTILETNPDVVCLQEVEQSAFASYFFPILQARGYSGAIETRMGKTDGCATFYRKSRFVLLEKERVNLYHEGGREMDRGNIGLITLLQHRSHQRRILCVANTHLVYNPKRGDIKLAQCAILMHATASCIARCDNPDNVAVLVSGDFNSLPRSKIMQFCVTGSLEHYGLDRRYLSGQIKTPPGSVERLAVVPPKRSKKIPVYAIGTHPVCMEELPHQVRRSIRVERRMVQRRIKTFEGGTCDSVITATSSVASSDPPGLSSTAHMSAFAVHEAGNKQTSSPVPLAETFTEVVETLEYATVTHPLQLRSAFPDEGFTTLQDTGASTVDHILFDSRNLKATAVLGLRGLPQILSEGGLPNPWEPSDHQLIAAQFAFT